MKAWKLVKPNDLQLISDQPVDPTPELNAKVKMDRILFTREDFCVLNGTLKTESGIVIGSCGVGVVSEVYDPQESRIERMDRVVIEPYIACRNCLFCKTHKYQMCVEKKQLGINSDGLMQDFVCLPQKCLAKIPDGVSSSNALMTAPISFALNIIDKINLEKGDHVAVFGGGKLGVILSCLITYYQAVPIFVESDAALKNIALDKNVFYTFDATKTVTNEIFNATGGRMCEKVVYFAESDLPISVAIEACGQNSVFCVGGLFNKKTEFSVPSVQKKNLTVCGVDNPYGNFPSALNILAKNIIKADDFVCQEVSFADVDKTLPAVEEMQTVDQNIIVKCE